MLKIAIYLAFLVAVNAQACSNILSNADARATVEFSHRAGGQDHYIVTLKNLDGTLNSRTNVISDAWGLFLTPNGVVQFDSLAGLARSQAGISLSQSNQDRCIAVGFAYRKDGAFNHMAGLVKFDRDIAFQKKEVVDEENSIASRATCATALSVPEPSFWSWTAGAVWNDFVVYNTHNVNLTNGNFTAVPTVGYGVFVGYANPTSYSLYKPNPTPTYLSVSFACSNPNVVVPTRLTFNYKCSGVSYSTYFDFDVSCF